jgi:hypothetical protein
LPFHFNTVNEDVRWLNVIYETSGRLTPLKGVASTSQLFFSLRVAKFGPSRKTLYNGCGFYDIFNA